MKILYDISLLGISHRNGCASGLMRVAEQLLHNLILANESGMSDLEIATCGHLSFDTAINCQEYLDSVMVNSARPDFVKTNKVNQRQLIYQCFTHLVQKLPKVEVKKNKALYHWIMKLLELGFRGLSLQDLEGVDLYHSPYHAIPEAVKQSKHLRQVLTVHDIIPMLHPEFFGLKADLTGKDFYPEFNLLAVLQSIDSDVWITCPSQSTKQDLCQYLSNQVVPEQVKVVPWAASNLFYKCHDREKINFVRQKYDLSDRSYILSLGTLEPRKNIDHLIRCFRLLLLQEKLEDLTLVLVGSLGWQYESILKTISDDIFLSKRVILTGYVADEDLAALYSDALVFVYPSLYEGFGLPPLEAMQCGTPVITSNTSSLPEVIGKAGLMVDPSDQSSLCQHLLEIYQRPDLRSDLSKRSMERAQQFSWEASAQQMVKVYQQALQ